MSKFADPRACWEAIRPVVAFERRCIIAIDGPDCSGKTRLATSLVGVARGEGIRASAVHVDDLFVREVTRPRRNPDAVSEFLMEFFSYQKLPDVLLGSSGVVFVEGMFLLRPSLLPLYRLKIRLELDERDVFERAMTRDAAKFVTWGDFALHYVSQALPAQRLYKWFCDPESVADLVVRLSDRQSDA